MPHFHPVKNILHIDIVFSAQRIQKDVQSNARSQYYTVACHVCYLVLLRARQRAHLIHVACLLAYNGSACRSLLLPPNID